VPLNNATLTQGPDVAEDGFIDSRPLNNTMEIEPDGALDGTPSCGVLPPSFNLTLEQEMDQGQDGKPQSCSLRDNSTLEVDREQGEDRELEFGGTCSVVPDGMILTPLANLGDYAPLNGSSPLLDSQFPVSWLDEQGDDWEPSIEDACPIPNITDATSGSIPATAAGPTSLPDSRGV
jgi:hypothetical protein